ncbi:MAG: YifB family Mg chelatase-like AAA ATPase [Bdellovibrionales bacterium]|nr:YifB family Mg chelatase-like AAA ATPase [Bdellovibrionales bacterium]
MLAIAKTASLYGIECVPVRVEGRIRAGKSSFQIIGLGDVAIREARERVSSAIRSLGYSLPDQILINLAPAEVKKEGSCFDLAIAVSILCAAGVVEKSRIESVEFYGELGLDGTIKSVRGLLPLLSRSLDTQELLVPYENLREAQLASDEQCIGVRTLREVLEYLSKGLAPNQDQGEEGSQPEPLKSRITLSDIVGQQKAKEALTIAAAGGHNLLFVGPPGCGKSMIAERLPQILPPLSRSERLEAVKVASICGEPLEMLLQGKAPFRSPHHTVSDVALTGGGLQLRPGEVSLAHRGVLFLDEFPEFRRTALEALRAPLESGKVRVVRARGSVEYPASFQLVAAMNRCPCGRLGVPGTDCTCSRNELLRYLGKLSQPILDRIDLQVDCEAVPLSSVKDGYLSSVREPDSPCLETESVRERVERARLLQLERQGCTNGTLSGSLLRKVITLGPEAEMLLNALINKRDFSARRLVRILRVSRTLADLEQRKKISDTDIGLAVSFMALSRIEQFAQGG